MKGFLTLLAALLIIGGVVAMGVIKALAWWNAATGNLCT